MISHSAPVHVTELIVMPVNRYLVDSLASHESVIMPLHDQAINFNYLLLQHLIAIWLMSTICLIPNWLWTVVRTSDNIVEAVSDQKWQFIASLDLHSIIVTPNGQTGILVCSTQNDGSVMLFDHSMVLLIAHRR